MTDHVPAIAIRAVAALDDTAQDDLLAILLGVDTIEGHATGPHAATLSALYAALDAEQVASLREEYDICPLHACDAAICRDDEDPECQQEITAV